MKEMGWTYEQYCKTPRRIVDEVWAFIQTENKVMADKMPKER